MLSVFQFACFERRFSGQEEFISGQLSFLIVHELAEHMYIYINKFIYGSMNSCILILFSGLKSILILKCLIIMYNVQ